MTTGHRLFCKAFLCFNNTPCRHMPLLVHFWDDAVGNPHRAHIYQFVFFEFVILLKSDRQFSIVQFEARVSQSTVPCPPSKNGGGVRKGGVRKTHSLPHSIWADGLWHLLPLFNLPSPFFKIHQRGVQVETECSGLHYIIGCFIT